MTKHYDDTGKYIGRSSDEDDSSVFVFIVIGFGIAAVYFLGWGWEKVTNWQSLEIPYRYIAAFYNYSIVIPAKAVPAIGNWLSSKEFTQYPNLNITIAGLGVVTYIAGIVFIIRSLINLLDYFGYEAKTLWIVLIAPSVLGGIWFLLLAVFNWLFATG